MWIAAHLPLAAGLLLLAIVDARAAGGHFDVDDATVLDPGHCQYEAWAVRAPALATTAFHLGPTCRVGPVEIGVNLDRARIDGESRTFFGPQLKWVVDPLIDRLSAGVAWSASFDTGQRGRTSQTLCVPATWWAAEKLWVHANIGRDWGGSGGHTRRIGLAGEWAVSDRWTVIAERIAFSGERSSRLGVRLNLNAAISVDASVARVMPQGGRIFVVGLNHDFAR